MQKPDDSLNINTSNDFVLDLTKDKINLYNPNRNNQTYDDLEYSIDQPSYQLILGDLAKQQPKTIPNISAPVTMNREEDKKKERKAIFEKYKQKTDKKVDVMGLFDDVLRGKTINTVETLQSTNQQKRQIISSRQAEEGQIVSANISQGNKMNPPPNLLKKSSFQSPKNNDPSPISNIQNRNSNISMAGSFSLYDGYSAIMGPGQNNPFAHSRQSQQIAQLLDAEIFGSFRMDERSSIQVQVNQNHNNNMNILDDIRISSIGNRETKNTDNVFFNDINLADSQDHIFHKVIQNQNNLQNKVEKQKQAQKQQLNPIQNIKFQPLPIQNKQQTNTIPQSQQPSSTIQIQAHATSVQPNISITENILKPIPSMNKVVPQPSSNPHSESELSLNSNFLNGNNSSHLLSSNSLAKAFGNLSQYVFLEPISEKRMPQLLRQSWRLNSISINIHSLTLPLDALRHKQIIRGLIFQLFMASQTLQKFRDELQSRQIKQKQLYNSFSLQSYLEGEWYQISKIRNNDIIKPNQPHPKRPTDFNKIKDTLKNSVQVLKYFQNYIDRFKIQPTDDFKKKYIELRTSLFQIFSNLKKISQDLYMKSINWYLPIHYYNFYEFMKTPQYLSTNNLTTAQLSKKIKEREKILLQIQYFKNQHDPLVCSTLSKDIQRKAKNQLSILKSAYYNSKRKLSKN